MAVARARAAIADTAVTQSAEALRIVRKKYEGGLATVSELLDAAAAETQARVMRSDARFRYLVAAAVRLRAWGADPAALGALDSDLR
jgi:outer membrane protein TolC